MFLFIDILFNIECSLINFKLTANSNITHSWMDLISHKYFSHKIHHRPLSFKNTRQHYSITLVGDYKQQNRQQKEQQLKNVALNVLQKRYLFTVWEVKQEYRVSPCLPLDRNADVRWLKVCLFFVYLFFATLCMSVNDQANVTSIDFWIIKKNLVNRRNHKYGIWEIRMTVCTSECGMGDSIFGKSNLWL